MKENTYCSLFCVGFLCVISCIDSTFYNRDLHALKSGQNKKKLIQNTALSHTSKTLPDPFHPDPQVDPLYRDYFRQLEREFIGRGSNPLPKLPEVHQQSKEDKSRKTFVSKSQGHETSSSINSNKIQSTNPSRRNSFGNNFTPSLVKNPVVLPQLRKPPRRYNNHRGYNGHNNYGRHHWLPERLGRRPMANCNFQNDFDVSQLFPGLFRSEMEVMKQPDMVLSKGKKRPHMKVKDLPKVLWCPEKLKEENQLQTGFQSSRQHQMQQHPQFAAAKVQTNTVESIDPVSLGGPRLAFDQPCDPGCCKHVTGYAPITQVTINDVTYNAVNTTLLNQYLPVGVCPDTNTCGTGMCIQHQLTHWVLIWNNTLPYWPPLQFTRIELPGYCTWENVHVPPV